MINSLPFRLLLHLWVPLYEQHGDTQWFHNFVVINKTKLSTVDRLFPSDEDHRITLTAKDGIADTVSSPNGRFAMFALMRGDKAYTYEGKEPKLHQLIIFDAQSNKFSKPLDNVGPIIGISADGSAMSHLVPGQNREEIIRTATGSRYRLNAAEHAVFTPTSLLIVENQKVQKLTLDKRSGTWQRGTSRAVVKLSEVAENGYRLPISGGKEISAIASQFGVVTWKPNVIMIQSKGKKWEIPGRPMDGKVDGFWMSGSELFLNWKPEAWIYVKLTSKGVTKTPIPVRYGSFFLKR